MASMGKSGNILEMNYKILFLVSRFYHIEVADWTKDYSLIPLNEVASYNTKYIHTEKSFQSMIEQYRISYNKNNR